MILFSNFDPFVIFLHFRMVVTIESPVLQQTLLKHSPCAKRVRQFNIGLIALLVRYDLTFTPSLSPEFKTSLPNNNHKYS